VLNPALSEGGPMIKCRTYTYRGGSLHDELGADRRKDSRKLPRVL